MFLRLSVAFLCIFTKLKADDLNEFIKLLDEDFYNFLDESSFAVFDGFLTWTNTYANIGFPHDFSNVGASAIA